MNVRSTILWDCWTTNTFHWIVSKTHQESKTDTRRSSYTHPLPVRGRAILDVYTISWCNRKKKTSPEHQTPISELGRKGSGFHLAAVIMSALWQDEAISSINRDYILSSNAKGKTHSNCTLSARQPGRALQGKDHLLSTGGDTGSMGERERNFAII